MAHGLTLYGRPIATVFDLLGDKENDLTYAVGWGLAQSPGFAKHLLRDVFLGEEPGELVENPAPEHPEAGFVAEEPEDARIHIY